MTNTVPVNDPLGAKNQNEKQVVLRSSAPSKEKTQAASRLCFGSPKFSGNRRFWKVILKTAAKLKKLVMYFIFLDMEPLDLFRKNITVNTFMWHNHTGWEWQAHVLWRQRLISNTYASDSKPLKIVQYNSSLQFQTFFKNDDGRTDSTGVCCDPEGISFVYRLWSWHNLFDCQICRSIHGLTHVYMYHFKWRNVPPRCMLSS